MCAIPSPSNVRGINAPVSSSSSADIESDALLPFPPFSLCGGGIPPTLHGEKGVNAEKSLKFAKFSFSILFQQNVIFSMALYIFPPQNLNPLATPTNKQEGRGVSASISPHHFFSFLPRSLLLPSRKLQWIGPFAAAAAAAAIELITGGEEEDNICSSCFLSFSPLID